MRAFKYASIARFPTNSLCARHSAVRDKLRLQVISSAAQEVVEVNNFNFSRLHHAPSFKNFSKTVTCIAGCSKCYEYDKRYQAAQKGCLNKQRLTLAKRHISGWLHDTLICSICRDPSGYFTRSARLSPRCLAQQMIMSRALVTAGNLLENAAALGA